MNRDTRRVVGLTALGFALVIGTAPHTFAQDNAFKDGISRLGDRKWREAAEAMRAAIKSDPQESKREVRHGLFNRQGTPYLPHFYLGEALFNNGDCTGAVNAWVTAERHQVVQAHRAQYEVMRRGYAACEAKGILLENEFAPLVTAVTQSVNDAVESAQRVKDLGQANIELWQANAEMAQQYTDAASDIQLARGRLDAAKSTRFKVHFTEATAASTRAQGKLRDLEAALRSTVTVLQRQTRDVDQLLASAESAFRDVDAGGSALPPSLAKDRQTARDFTDRAREKLAEGRRLQSLAVVTEAKSLAQNASTILGKLHEQLRATANVSLKRRLDQVVNDADGLFSTFETSLGRLDALASERPEGVRPALTAEREVLRKQLATARRRAARARETGNIDAVEQAHRLIANERGRLDRLLAEFGPVSLRDRGVPAEVEDGLRLYLQGEHHKVVATLTPEAIAANTPLAIHALVLRAGSLYNLYVRSGEKDQSLLASARQAVDLSKKTNPAFQPDPRVFGRRFITFFNSTASVPSR